MKLRSGLFLCVVAVTTLILASCGGDDGGESTATTAPPAASAPNATEPGTDATSGGDDQGGGSDGAIDVCSMVTADTVTKVLGESAEPTPQAMEPTFSCRWEGPAEGLNMLDVGVTVYSDSDEAREIYEMGNADADSEIFGLGDGAVYSETFGLEVLSGNHTIDVDNTGPNEKQSDIEVAKLVLAALAD